MEEKVIYVPVLFKDEQPEDKILFYCAQMTMVDGLGKYTECGRLRFINPSGWVFATSDREFYADKCGDLVWLKPTTLSALTLQQGGEG